MVVVAGMLAGLREDNVRRLRAERDRADQARRVADENAAIAVGQRAVALDALASLVDEVQAKLDRPGMEPVRKSLLNIALEGLKRIDRSTASAGAAADQKSATAQMKLGDLFADTGKFEDARSAYVAANATFVRLARDAPSDAQALHDLFASFQRLGSISLDRGDTTGARENFEKSLDWAEAGVRAHPSSNAAKRDRSLAHSRLGDLSLQTGDLPAARKYFELMLGAQKAIAEAEPSNARAKRELAQGYEHIGSAVADAGDGAAAEAEAYGLKSLELSEELRSRRTRTASRRRWTLPAPTASWAGRA